MITFLLVGDDFPAAQTLQFLLDKEEARIVAVFSSFQRGFDARLCALANTRNIPFMDSAALKTKNGLEEHGREGFDWIININSTVVLPASVLALARIGAINMHPGRLPEYAGLHTHQWALRQGEKSFAATIHFMEARLDTGDIIMQREFEISPKDTGLTLYHKCMREGIRGLAEVLRLILAGEKLPRKAQDLSRYRLFRHGDALDERIDWTQSAVEIERFIRAGNYMPLKSPTYTACLDVIEVNGEDKKLQVLSAAPVELPSSDAHSGTVLHIEQGAAVAVVCGYGSGLQLNQLCWQSDNLLITTDELLTLLPHGSRQKGRVV